MYSSSDPQQKYLVLNSLTVTSRQQQYLVKLYQPLVSGLAVSLYNTLVQDFDPYQTLAQANPITQLQEELDTSLPALYQALHKLEATGLVDSFLVDSLGQKILAFQIQQVADPAAFFATPLLSSLLREKVGSVRFGQLSHYFARAHKLQNKKLRQANNVSATFFEVFNLPQQEAISPDQEVAAAARENQASQALTAQVNQGQPIDWDLIKKQFAIYQIPAREIDAKQAGIAALMQTYGLSEQEFVDESLPTLHGSYQLNLKKIAALFADNIKAEHSRQEVAQQAQKKPGKTAQMIAWLTPEDDELIKKANQMAPVEFLYYEKDKRGGFVSPYEKSLVNNLHSRYGFPSDVLNLLIDTCLQYNAVFSDKLAYQIGNDWLQHNIASAVQALDYQKKRRQKQPQRQKNWRQGKTVEEGTDWQHKKANTNVKMSDAEMDRIFADFGKKDQNKD